MPSRRLAFGILAGVAMFPFAIQKLRDNIGPYVISPPLLQIHKNPIPRTPVDFIDNAGQPLSLSDFKGRHVLVNIWATWCPPCRQEMPALDRLYTKLGIEAEPEIIAISVDAVSIEQLQGFYAANGIVNLKIYRGVEPEILQGLMVGGLPTTLLLDHDGSEVARLIGPTTWDAPELVDQISKLVM